MRLRSLAILCTLSLSLSCDLHVGFAGCEPGPRLRAEPAVAGPKVLAGSGAEPPSSESVLPTSRGSTPPAQHASEAASVDSALGSAESGIDAGEPDAGRGEGNPAMATDADPGEPLSADAAEDPPEREDQAADDGVDSADDAAQTDETDDVDNIRRRDGASAGAAACGLHGLWQRVGIYRVRQWLRLHGKR
jgi:hypothetical protein